MPVDMTPEQIDRRRALFTPCATREELREWVYFFLDVDLPHRVIDDRSNTTALDMVWECYAHFMHPPKDGSEQPAERLYYASRDSGKTLSQSIIEVLALLHINSGVVHLAAIEEQSRNAQAYLKKFFSRPDLYGFVVGDNVRSTEVVYYRPFTGDGLNLTEKEWRGLVPQEQRGYERVVNKAECVVATLASTNGKHAGILCLDEVDLVRQPQVINEAKNIPTNIKRPDGTEVDPLTIYTSTRKSAFGPVQDAINEAPKTGLVVKHWNILDITKACPPERHLPDAPRIPIYYSNEDLSAIDEPTYQALDAKTQERYVKREGYQGCLSNCKIFAACRGHLVRQVNDSEFLKPLSTTLKKLRTNSVPTARAQLLCLEPSSTGLIYPGITDKHILTPAQVYQMIDGGPPPDGDRLTKAELMRLAHETFEVRWAAAQDYGYTHFFVHVLGLRYGNKFFILRCIAHEELDPVQKIQLSEPLKKYQADTYGDPESPSDIALFRKHGFKMREWKKGKGSVEGGIDIVRGKLNAMSGEPELYFVRDVGDDPEMDLCIKHMREYHWLLDAAGKPTNVPDEENDDIPDAVRYLVMNVFPHRKGGFAVAHAAETVIQSAPTAPTTTATRQNEEMRKIIEDATGSGVGAQVRDGVIKKGRLVFVG